MPAQEATSDLRKKQVSIFNKSKVFTRIF